MGHAATTPLHVIAAVCRRDEAAGAKHFGEHVKSRIEVALKLVPKGLVSPGDSADLTEMVNRAAFAEDPLKAFFSDLSLALNGVAVPAQPATENKAGATQAAACSTGQEASMHAAAAMGPIDRDAISLVLKSRLAGQDSTIDALVRRLAVTRAQLDLKPNRPDGVFLFAGPTGVGKTSLALALAEAVYGSAEACIRIDMSEYDNEVSATRLIGPPPGYVGSDDPSNWLTTKVREKPESVVLFDEIEKAHPRVWNTMLQIFDAGRLTDSQGKVADFSRNIVVLTSNLGSERFRQRQSIGFVSTGDDVARESGEKTVDAIREAMPPELINRLDEILIFSALSAESIRAIAKIQIEELVARLKPRGFDISVDPAIVDYIARSGYDPAYGARHLHRTIERQLLEPLVLKKPGRLVAKLGSGGVDWVPIAV